MALNSFKSKIFPLQPTERTGKPGILARAAEVFDCRLLKILTTKEMLKRLPIALAQVKAGDTSENLVNEIRQIIYSLYQAKRTTKMCITI